MKYQALLSSKDKSTKRNKSVICCNFAWLFKGEKKKKWQSNDKIKVSHYTSYYYMV